MTEFFFLTNYAGAYICELIWICSAQVHVNTLFWAPGSSRAHVISCRGPRPSRLALANTPPRVSCSLGRQGGRSPGQAARFVSAAEHPPRRMNLYLLGRAFTAATDSAPEAPWRRRCLQSRGKSLFAPRALTSLSRGGERDALPLITREAGQGEARGGEAARKSPHRDYQMWHAFHLCREVTFCSRILPWPASKGHNRERIPFLFWADKERAMPLEANGQHQ